MLRVEDIHHRPDTQDRLDKAAATQLVFEDAMIHVVDHLLRSTGANRLVLTGGVALNAVGNMRLLEHFDAAWFAKAQQRNARLHLWVPPTPGDPGVTIGAAWLFAHLAGAPRGAPMTHAFYCGLPPSQNEIADRAQGRRHCLAPIGDISTPNRSRRHCRSDGVHRRAERRDRALSGRGRNRPARARPSLDPRQPLRPANARTAQRARQIPRGDPAAGADGDAGGGAANISSCSRAPPTPTTTPTTTWC